MINMIFAQVEKCAPAADKAVVAIYDYFVVYYTNGKSKQTRNLTLKEENFIRASYLKGNMHRTFSGILYMHDPKSVDTCSAERMRIRSIRERYYKRLKRHGWKIVDKYIMNGEERVIIRKE